MDYSRVNLYNGKYFQGSLRSSEATKILDVLDKDVFTDLRHCIFNIPDYAINELIDRSDEYKLDFGTMDNFVSEIDENALKLGTLNDFQTIGVAFGYYAKAFILGDSVGLGKTVQISGLANILRRDYKKQNKRFKFLFLTESPNVGQIRSKLIQFTGEYVDMIVSAEAGNVAIYMNQNKNGHNFSVAGSHSLLESPSFIAFLAKYPFDMIIIDESSVIKNKSTSIYKNARLVLNKYERKILLNATPLEKNALEFYNQLDLLDHDYMPGITVFKDNFCVMKWTTNGYVIDGYKNTEKFKEATKLRYLARTRRDLGATIEGNAYKTLIIPLSKAQKELLTKTSLYQLVSDYPTGVDKRIEFNEETTPKLRVLMGLVKNLDIENDKLLLYCKFVECQQKLKERLEEKGYAVVILNGKTPAKERTRVMSDFNNGIYNIIITNIQRGVDLENCENLILYTIEYNPQKMVQVEGRITRNFDVQYKTVYLLVASGKEKKIFENRLKMRVEASDAFTITDDSMILNAIRGNDKVLAE